MAASNTYRDIYRNSQPGPALPGGVSYSGGGGDAGAVQYRTKLDAARAGATPYAQYPDGYLGTITDRQQDKLLGKIQERMTDKSYQRGVHVGSKIGTEDYFWPKGYDPSRGLARESRVVPSGNLLYTKRYAPTGNPVELLAHLGKLGGLTSPEKSRVYMQYGVNEPKNPVVIQDPTRAARMQKMLPKSAL